MFHTYVRATSGRKIDFDRATWLMDQSLLRQAEKAMEKERAAAPIDGASYGAQWLWGYYCERHWEKYGEAFRPDEDESWDVGNESEPLTPEQIAEFDRFEAVMQPNGIARFVERPSVVTLSATPHRP